MILESSGTSVITVGSRAEVPASVVQPLLVAPEAPRHDHQPGREFAANIGDIGTKTAEVVLVELLQHVGIRVHRGVILATQRASRMQ
jgi:hypothetical protein